MPRDFNDTTSTCGSCIYFSPDPPDGGPPDGHCNWLSLPAYVYKNVKEFNTHMRADAGKECWLHTKREEFTIDAQSLLKHVAMRVTSNACRICGHEHNMMPCPEMRPVGKSEQR